MSHLHCDPSLGSALTASQKHKGIRTVLLSTFGPIMTHIDSFSTLLFTYYNPLLDSPDTGEVHNMGHPMLYPKAQKRCGCTRKLSLLDVDGPKQLFEKLHRRCFLFLNLIASPQGVLQKSSRGFSACGLSNQRLSRRDKIVITTCACVEQIDCNQFKGAPI